jgi:hypothetical protein
MTSKSLRFGLVGALFLGACHLMWAMLVAMGWAQSVINFIFWIHFIQPPYTIAPFDIWIAAILVTVVSAVGFAMGYVLAVIWDRCLAD